MKIDQLSKEHEELFPRATMESQVWKLEEEMMEYLQAKTREKKRKERADILIVCGGLHRWCPVQATFMWECFWDPELDKEVDRKWAINRNRTWAWTGKTYKHVGIDGNE